jgi:hypothetical protein
MGLRMVAMDEMDEPTIWWPREADAPGRVYEYVRVRDGHAAAVYEYELAQRNWQRMMGALPAPVQRALAADPYGPPAVTWEEAAPYVPSALEATSDGGDLWSWPAADFLHRLDVWFPDLAQQVRIDAGLDPDG